MKNYIIGSVGKIIPDLQVKISSDGEILLKGKTITSGYYKRPDANKEAFTEDGFFRTGDAGYLDMDNNLYITDRIKDLFKTAGGKYIAPQLLESIISDDALVEQAVAIGNERKYVSMLIVPDYTVLEPLIKNKGLTFDSRAELIKMPEVLAIFESMIQKRNEGLARYEQIKRFTLLEKPFTMEQGHLTNTLKIKRKVVNELFAKEIDAMYPND
jgi:long-chain acyl-CoA synthetase